MSGRGGGQLLAKTAGQVGDQAQFFRQGRGNLAVGEGELRVEEEAGDGGFELGLDGGLKFRTSEPACGLAQSFDIVEGALLGEEDVDDDVNVVQEYPLGLTATFDGGGVEAVFLLEAELDFIRDGDHLAIVGGGGDEE